MALPVMSSTVYNTVIPSIKKSIKFKPFLVKQQKALLIAQQSEDATTMIDTLKSVIKECIIDDVDIDALAIFDIEYLFLQIRAKSVGEIVELLFTCTACAEQTKISFNLTDINVIVSEGHNKKIDLGNNVGIVMKYPDISMLKMIENFNDNDVNIVFDVIVSCIDYVYDENAVYHANEYTIAELSAFIESLNTTQFASIQKFFDTMPKLQQKVVYDCPKCGQHHDQVLEGINNFF